VSFDFTASTATGIFQKMQSLGRMYVLYFNKQYHRSGTLWEGRYKSCLVLQETYLIELNPFRAGMVEDPADYSWSSYQCNALGKKTGLLTPHPLFMALGNDEKKRMMSYRALFSHYVEGKLLEDIRQANNKGLALGNEHFIDDVEAVTSKHLREGKRGRPLGWRKMHREKWED
jgi:putative transposase